MVWTMVMDEFEKGALRDDGAAKREMHVLKDACF